MFLWVDENNGILFLSGIIEVIKREVARLVSYITRSVGLRSIVDADN